MSSKYDYPPNPGDGRERIPPGATKRASDRTARPWSPDDYTDLDDRHAAGTPAGGTEVGGMAGSNVGGGDPQPSELAEASATGAHPPEADDDGAYSGPAGGSVGGAPAGRRASGGRTGGGLRPGGEDRGDSTVGAGPDEE
jgi:hypothetical protein